MPEPHLNPSWPGRYHEAVEEGGVIRVVATESFSRRDRSPVGIAVALFLCLSAPAVWYSWRAGDGAVAAGLWGYVALVFSWLVVPSLLPPPPRDPLRLTRSGRIEYRNAVLLDGPVTAVRIVRRPDGADNPDTYHVVCAGAGGTWAELPAPDFGGTTDLREIAILAVWLAHLFGVDRPTDVEAEGGAVETSGR